MNHQSTAALYKSSNGFTRRHNIFYSVNVRKRQFVSLIFFRRLLCTRRMRSGWFANENPNIQDRYTHTHRLIAVWETTTINGSTSIHALYTIVENTQSRDIGERICFCINILLISCYSIIKYVKTELFIILYGYL